MKVTELPIDAFDIHIKRGHVVHYKRVLEVQAASRGAVLEQIALLGFGKVVQLLEVDGKWHAKVEQSVNLDADTKSPPVTL